MKNSHIFYLVLGLILLTAVLTNPDQDRHKEVLKAKFNSIIQHHISEGPSETNDEWLQLGHAFEMVLVGGLLDRLLSNMMTIDNYVIFSTTKIFWGGESKVIGIGAFGNVFLTRETIEILEEEILTQ